MVSEEAVRSAMIPPKRASRRERGRRRGVRGGVDDEGRSGMYVWAIRCYGQLDVSLMQME